MNEKLSGKSWMYCARCLLVFSLLFPLVAAAQEVKILSMDEAVKLSLASSKSLKISRAQILASQARLAQAKDRMLPSVAVSGSYYRIGQPDVNLGSGLKNLLGGNKGSGQGAGSGSQQGAAPAFPTVNQATLAQASLSEPIFAGFKTRYAIQSEEYLLKAATFSADNTREEVVLNTLSAYYNIYKLQANKVILQQDLDEQTRRVKDFSNLEQNGLLTRNDLLKAEVQKSNIQLNLLDVSNALDVATYNLKIMIGLPENTSVQIDTLHIFSNHQLRSREEYLQDAGSKRNDLQANQLNQETSRLAIKSAKSAYYPSVTLSGGFIDAWVPNLVTVKNVTTASIGVQYNLTGLFTTKHKVQEAQAGLLEARAQYEQLSDNIRMAVNQNYLAYTEALARIELTGTTINQTAENYRILNNKYKNSLSTLTDLLDGELAVLQARINLAASRADAEIAWYRLQNSSGNNIKTN